MIGLSPIGNNSFAKHSVAGKNLVPRPPAKIIAFFIFIAEYVVVVRSAGGATPPLR